MKQLNVMLTPRLVQAVRRAAKLEFPRRTGWLTLWMTDVLREALRFRAEDPGWLEKWKERYGVSWDPGPIEGEVTTPGAWEEERAKRKKTLADYGLKEADAQAGWRAYNRGLPIHRIVLTLEREAAEPLTARGLVKLWQALGLKVSNQEERRLARERDKAVMELLDRYPGMTRRQAVDAALVAASRFEIDLAAMVRAAGDELPAAKEEASEA